MPPRVSAALTETLSTLSSTWPVDRLRPKLQFGALIETINERVASGQLRRAELERAEASANALKRLVQNDAMETYPVTDKTLKPKSAPMHYVRVMDAIDGKPDSRSWWDRFMGRQA